MVADRACSRPPWIENPYRPVSLGELMNRFHAQWFIDLSARMGGAKIMGEEHPNDIFDANDRGVAINAIHTWMPLLAGLGFTSPAKAMSRMLTRLADPQPMLLREYGRWAEDLQIRFVEATEDVLFIALDANETYLLNAHRLFGQEVADKYPSAEYDIAEAGRALAMHRSTACVFHLCRVMEHGLRALGKSLNDPKLAASRNPTWNTVLVRCRQELEKEKTKRSPEWRKHDTFHSGAYTHLLGVKEAWRNPTMHIASKYTEEEAQDIYDHVRRFMGHLATVLSE